MEPENNEGVSTGLIPVPSELPQLSSNQKRPLSPTPLLSQDEISGISEVIDAKKSRTEPQESGGNRKIYIGNLPPSVTEKALVVTRGNARFARIPLIVRLGDSRIRRTQDASQSHADFSRLTVAVKIDILKNQKHFIITKKRKESIFEKILKNMESEFFPEYFCTMLPRLI